MKTSTVKLDRRAFLQAGLAVSGGLLLGLRLDNADAASLTPFMPNAFVRIAADDSVTVITKILDMGQGVHTGLATLLAGELDADWAQIHIEAAPADASRYNNLNWGTTQGTGSVLPRTDGQAKSHRQAHTPVICVYPVCTPQ